MANHFLTMKPDRRAAVEAFLAHPFLARMATASPATLQPHVVPVWYLWDGENVWINSYSSTRKVRDLEANPLISIVVDTAEGVEGVGGVLFEGRAEIIRGPLDFLQAQIARIYIRYLGEEGVLAPDPQEWIHSPEALLIKLAPARVNVW